MKLKEIIFKRESLTLPINGKEETWDYLTIYNSNGLVLIRSGHHHPEGNIYLTYQDYVFFAPPISKQEGEDYIYITIASIKKQLK